MGRLVVAALAALLSGLAPAHARHHPAPRPSADARIREVLSQTSISARDTRCVMARLHALPQADFVAIADQLRGDQQVSPKFDHAVADCVG